MTGKAPSLIAKIAERFSVDPDKLFATLKQTAFRQREKDPQPSNEEMMALLIVADQHGLNPFTKELYAFLDPKKGGIIAVVSVDGWLRIINSHPQFDGMEFVYSEELVEWRKKKCHVWIDCIISRKDRAKPIVIREFFDEVVREVSFTTPWDTHPRRMHRHKAIIQCGRVAFGFAGIYDPDEAERIIEQSDVVEGELVGKPGDIPMPQAVTVVVAEQVVPPLTPAPHPEQAAAPAVVELPKAAETPTAKTAEQEWQTQPAQPAKAPPAAAAEPITDGMKKVLMKKMLTFKVTEETITKHFGVSELSQIPKGRINEAMELAGGPK